MNFVPSLEHLALINFAISVHNTSEFLESQEKLRKPCGFIDFFPVKRLFRDILLSKYVVPIRLREKLLGIIRPISYDIENCKMQLSDYGVRNQVGICLTSFGTIDRIESFKKFVRNDDENVAERFGLACFCWMTNDVLEMWNKASLEERSRIERKLLYPKNSTLWMLGSVRRRTQEQFEKMETTQFLKKWFDWLHDGGDPCTQRNFLDESLFWSFSTFPEPNLLRALPPEELRQLIKYKFNTSYGRVYFSCLDYDQKLRLFQQEPFIILRDYLKWPLQSKFLEMASQALKYLTGKEFFSLLQIISKEKMAPWQRKISHESDFDYEGLLHEFWKQSPHHLKISAKEHHDWQRQTPYNPMAEGMESPLQRLLDNDPSVAQHQTKTRRFVHLGPTNPFQLLADATSVAVDQIKRRKIMKKEEISEAGD
ncbi:uncharacterized protein TNCT_499871 [Trichonephila clavata]|uniref:Uncharacterized protein n=1 Tax=Trichonephila clavata TaxID=2740835 RepID=A0A8X6H575_TRICU|nr:uncharacterized protein TNCT_499871 [Trichonephila clavata]